VKVRSPAFASPFVPSSKSGDDEPSPAQLRSQFTDKPVLVGSVPGVTTAVIVSELPGDGSSGAVVTLRLGAELGEACVAPDPTSTETNAKTTNTPNRKRAAFTDGPPCS
jgi:hypothetical protein